MNENNEQNQLENEYKKIKESILRNDYTFQTFKSQETGELFLQIVTSVSSMIIPLEQIKDILLQIEERESKKGEQEEKNE